MNKEIGALTGLRGVAALWVLVFHIQDMLKFVGGGVSTVTRIFGAAGYLGVDVFFVLSGFVLALNYSNAGLHASASSYASFIWARLARIYPVHVAALVLYCVFVLATIAFSLSYSYANHLTLQGFLRSLTLTHGWSLPIRNVWNPVSWSVSTEFAAYLCFPIFAVMAMRFRSIASACAFIGLLFLALVSAKYYGVYSGAMAYGMVRIFVEFPAGILVFRIWQLSQQRPTLRFDVLASAVLAILVVCSNVIDFGARRQLAILWMPIVSCALIYALACATGPLQRFLCGRTMQHFGRVSYSFYMVHGVFISMAAAVMTEYGLYNVPWKAVSMTLGCVVAAYGCSVWFYRSIENPARRFMLSIRSAPARSVVLKDPGISQLAAIDRDLIVGDLAVTDCPVSRVSIEVEDGRAATGRVIGVRDWRTDKMTI